MTASRSITVGGWLALTGSALLCLAAWFAAYRWRPLTQPREHDIPALTAEREQLRGNEDAVRDTLRAQVGTTQSAGRSEQALAGWPAALGPDWRVEWRRDPTVTRATAIAIRPDLNDWATYLAFIERWSQIPGVVLESIALRAEGGRHDRRLVRVEIGLRFHREVAPAGDAERSGPSPGPLPVAPADSSAAPRKVGPVTPLHRPAASAKPPAAGPASASFRPDPPGPWAGSTQQPQPKSP